MKKLLLTLLLLSSGLSSLTAEELPLKQFMELVRHPRTEATYAMLEGKVQHRRRHAKPEQHKVYFGVIIQKERVTGQLIIGGKDVFVIGQSRANGVSSVTPTQGSTATLNRIGLRATDLTMGFIYYPVVKELEPARISGIVPCRVVLFKAPDGKEEVKVFLSSEHAFPLRAEFFQPGAKKPHRTLECGGFTKRNELYYARELLIEGPGWRTKVEFDSSRAQLGLFDAKNPARIMRQVK